MKKIKLIKSVMSGIALTCIAANANAYQYAQFQGAFIPDEWTGAYFGTYFGAGHGDADQSFRDRQMLDNVIQNPTSSVRFFTIENGSGKLSGNATGSIADLFIGYNFHIACPNLILGAQLEGTFYNDISFKMIGTRNSLNTDIITSTSISGTNVTTITEAENSTDDAYDELRSMFKIVGRGGYLLAQNMLLYALLGAVEGNFVVPANENFFWCRTSTMGNRIYSGSRIRV